MFKNNPKPFTTSQKAILVHTLEVALLAQIFLDLQSAKNNADIASTTYRLYSPKRLDSILPILSILGILVANVFGTLEVQVDSLN